MKVKYLGLLVALLVVASIITIVPVKRIQNKKYSPREFKKCTGAEEENGITGAIEWLNRRRVNITTGKVELSDILKVENELKLFSKNSKSSLNLEWSEMGPNNVGGRTRALLIDKDNNNLMFAGGVSGGLWKSTTAGESWVKYSDTLENLIICSITQTDNGDIYFGTGESFASFSGDGGTNTGFKGAGIWKSIDHGQTFKQLTSTWDDALSLQTFYGVNELAHDGDTVYAATMKGIRVSKDGGDTWVNPVSTSFSDFSSVCKDIQVASDGTVIAALNDKCYLKSSRGGSFERRSGTGTGAEEGYMPYGTGRLEFAFAPSDPNYVYCLAATPSGTLHNLYYSTNKGQKWTNAFPTPLNEQFKQFFGSSTNQGYYDNVIAVYPDNPKKVIMGAIDLHSWSLEEGYSQITTGFAVHADQHAIVFHPKYNGTTNKILFVSNDGGVFRNTNGGKLFTSDFSSIAWAEMNRNYNVTQFYKIDCGGNGDVIGGTQDNGTLYLDLKGNTPLSALDAMSGDGGGSAISKLSPNVLFVTIYYGQLFRTENIYDPDFTARFSGFYSGKIKNQHDIGGGYPEPFVTPIALWESFNDINSIDSVKYIVIDIDTTDSFVPKYYVGDKIYPKSNIHENIFEYTLTIQDIAAYAPRNYITTGDSVFAQDPQQAVLAVGLANDVWITRYPLNFKAKSNWRWRYPPIESPFTNPPMWYPIVNSSTEGLGTVETMAWSKDGDILYVADNMNKVYRFSNILKARTSDQIDATLPTCVIKKQLIGTFSQAVTSIAVDPVISNNIVVTLGNYGSTNFVYYSTNAATTTSSTNSVNFTSKQSNLPKFPVYSSVINWKDSKKVIIGTEYGVFSTDDITASSPVWTDENANGMPRVPVFSLVQQSFTNSWQNKISNHGVIYAGTHGRGIFKSETLQGPLAINPITNTNNNSISLRVFPNPTSEIINTTYIIDKPCVVKYQVYNLQGKLIISENMTYSTSGKKDYSINTQKLKSGTYILQVKTESKTISSKFVVL